VLGGELEERPVGADAGVGDHDVDAAEAVDRGCDGGVHRLRLADVAGDPEPTLEAEVVPSTGRQADRGTGLVQRTGDRGTDAAARSGDERDSAFERHATPLIAGYRDRNR
jgi:hypothetical protein